MSREGRLGAVEGDQIMNALPHLRTVAFALSTLSLSALPALAQTRDENRRACLSDDNDVSIAGCTADINSGEETIPADLARAYYNRGLSYAHKHEYDAAIVDYTKAIALNGNDSTYHVARGEAYYNSGDLGSAMVEFDAALKIDPNDAAAKKDMEQANGD
jgi:tetratricopeptide (TPR) repeat protein